MLAKPKNEADWVARILIVDDEAPQMKALCDTLRDHGYETVGFTHPKDALAKLSETKFDLLLSDLMMPDTDGIALLAAALQKDPDLVGIIMTGQGTIDTAVEAMKAGALDYILKPFKLSYILPVLSRALAVRQLRLQNAALEKHLRERTAQLEAANRELEAFSYSVSHDLRAPVRAISGFASMLVKQNGSTSSPELAHWLGRIVNNASTMELLIDGLLGLARISRQPLARLQVFPKMLVKEILESLDGDITNRGVKFQVMELPACQADPVLLRQVFDNLISNAVKYTRKSSPAVVQIGFLNKNGEIIYFVQDNGVGFDMQYAGKLFGVFRRLHSAEEFEGTGVGLATVQRIIQRHGGRIWAEAEPNRGAVFYFTLSENTHE